MRFTTTLVCLLLLVSCTTSKKEQAQPSHDLAFAAVQSVINRYVSEQRIPGAIVLVKHGDRVSTYVAGQKEMGKGGALTEDTIFRIASMTKPIVTVAALTLVDDGRIRLSDPISKYLPEFKNLRVLKKTSGPLDQTTRARRAPTVEDLLMNTWGSGMLFFEADGKGMTYPIQQAMVKKGVVTAPPLPPVTISPDEWSSRLASLPLMHQPGERWMYNTATDVLGVLIARVSKQSLPDFLEAKIFGPLDMSDTGFFVPAEKHSRFLSAYFLDSRTNKKTVIDPVVGYYSKPPVFPSGSAGLVSTARDYLKFAEMLMNGGALGSVRILKESTVKEMTTDHLSEKIKSASPFMFRDFWQNVGWGYGVSVQTKGTGIIKAPGTYGWTGGFGTDWFNDPNNRVTGIVLTQLSIDFGLFTEVRKAIYSSIEQ